MLDGAIPLRHGQAFQLSYDHLGIGGCSCTVHVYRVVEIIGPIHKVLVAIMIEEGQVVFAANIFQRLIHLVVMRVELWRNGKHQLGAIGFTCHNQLFQVMQLKRIVLIINPPFDARTLSAYKSWSCPWAYTPCRCSARGECCQI